MVTIYNFTLNGSVIGCGTKAEFDYWTLQGVFSAGCQLGGAIGEEDASIDQSRKQEWGIA